MLFPEAGGSSSFARHAFNEVISFGAAWAQMLNYIITVAISAFFVPHYLSIFWGPLRTNPWDIVGGIVVVVILVGINIVGIQEAAALNVFLAVVDFATQLLLVMLGFVLVFSRTSSRRTSTGAPRRRGRQFALAIPVAMIAYTGIETVSNLAEEARDPRRSIPGSIRLVAIAVFAIYFTLPLVALSALPVHKDAAGDYVTRLGLHPPRGLRERPGARDRREPRPARRSLLSAAKLYVGVLAATILFIATNAGVIGASRITYSMASYRQIPERFRRLHPRFKTPVLALVVFAGVLLDPLHAARQRRLHRPDVRVRRDALVHGRARVGDPDAPEAAAGRGAVPRAAELCASAASTGRSSRSSAELGTAAAWLVVVVQDAPTRYAGLGWLAIGFVFYSLYRRRLGRAAGRDGARADPARPGDRARVPADPRPGRVAGPRGRSRSTSPRPLAAERGATIVALRVIVVPMELPLDARAARAGARGRPAARRGPADGRDRTACA